MKSAHFWGKVVAAVAIATMAATASGTAAVAATTATPAPATSTATPGSQDWVLPLVGSPHRLVYELAHDVSGSTVQQPTDYPYALVSRNDDGTTKTFSLDGLTTTSSVFAKWSMSQNIVTAEKGTFTKVGRVYTFFTRAYWWNVATGASGSMSIPEHSYVGADPNGVLTLTKTGRLQERSTTGTVTTLSRPFQKRPTRLNGRSNANGIVLGGWKVHSRYLRFDSPTTVTKLDNPTKDSTVCWAVSNRVASCTTHGAEQGEPRHAALLPLSGKKSVAVPANARTSPNNTGLIGARTLVWISPSNVGDDASWLHTYKPASKTSTVIRNPSDDRYTVSTGTLVSAYGGFVLPAADGHRLFANTGTTALTTLVTAPTS